MTDEERRAYFAAQQRKYAAKYPEKVREATRLWRQKNQERIRAWRIETKDKAREYQRAWRRKNKAIRAEREARRSARQPKWANTFFITEIYELAQLRSRITGIRWEVDHVIPINNPSVCGLHVEHNLRVIPATANWTKGNRFDIGALNG